MEPNLNLSELSGRDAEEMRGVIEKHNRAVEKQIGRLVQLAWAIVALTVVVLVEIGLQVYRLWGWQPG
jgi:hypothetical protein